MSPSTDPALDRDIVDEHYAVHCDGTRVERLADILRRRAAATPDDIAMLEATGSTTFAQLDARSSQVAQALLRDGVGVGDRVAYVGANGPSFLEVLNGAARVGALATAVNNRLVPTEIAAILADAEPVVVVLGRGDGWLAPALQGVVSLIRTVTLDAVQDTTAYEAWLAPHPPVDPGFLADPHAAAILLYTSGTTGPPKGIMLSGDNLGRALSTLRSEIEFTAQSVAMAPVPYFHVAGFGLALAAQLAGSAQLLELAADVEALVVLLVRHSVTHAVLVPTLLQAIVNSPTGLAADWSALQYVIYGASPIPLPVIRQITAVMACKFIQSYGLTESTGGATMLRPEDHLPEEAHARRLTSAGKPLPGVGIRVVDPETLTDVAVGCHGEVLIGGGQVMKGYWRRPADTAAAILPGGWLRTGDGGSFDEDGYLYLHDRLKDMIISGGENVFPAEVESVLTAHPAIAEIAIIGVASERWGESPYAFAVLSPGEALSAADLIAWARERLAPFKCPVEVSFIPTLPRNASGKLLKAQLRASLQALTERR